MVLDTQTWLVVFAAAVVAMSVVVWFMYQAEKNKEKRR